MVTPTKKILLEWVRNERLRARRQQESHKQRENRLQLRRSRRLQARERESSEQRELTLQTRRERQDKEGSRKPLCRDNNACMDRLRTRNRNVAQDLLMHAMMIKSFLSMWENCYLSWKNIFTDIMKINVHPTNYHTHTHILIMLKLTMQSNVYM